MTLHAVAIGAAVAAGAFVAQASQRTPQVMVHPTEPRSVPAAPVQPMPQVRRELDVVLVEVPLAELVIVEPILPPPDVVHVDPDPLDDEPDPSRWSLVPVRRAPTNAPSPPVPPVPETPVPETEVRPEPADPIAAATAEAAPCADNEPPRYPDAERLRGHEGTIRLLVYVTEEGAVKAAELLEPCPHPGLNREALRAVRGWRFEPARMAGVATAGTTEVTVEFRLRER